MLQALLDRALARNRERLDLAFAAFAGGDPADKRLELRDSDPLQRDELGQLPYADGEFDWVACHALIETYGSHERQVRLLRELLRIARKGVFVTTPNRWHPLISRLRPGRELNLLDALDLKTMVDVLPGRPHWKLGHVRLVGFKSHFYLMIWKTGGEILADALGQQPVVQPQRRGNPPRDEAQELVQRFPQREAFNVLRVAPQMKHAAAP